MCFFVDYSEIRIDMIYGIRTISETLKLGMVSVSFRSPFEYMLSEESLTPESYESLGIEILRME